MPRNFILAFGGTGARCVEAFTYLLASRTVSQSCHILIIDPDQSNGNVEIARRQLERYQRTNLELRAGDDEPDKPFFTAPVNAEGSFFWANASAGLKWGEIIEYNSASAEKAALIDLLYDRSDLDLSFGKGYIGRAHIGSLDLKRTLLERAKPRNKDDATPSDALQDFFTALRSQTQGDRSARVMIFGSVFGGTGASGLPASPSFLVEALGENLRNKISLSAVTLAPYFTFPKGGNDSPDSAQHPLATQTALLHYATANTGYDRLYLVGGPDRPSTNDNNEEGGEDQRNSAHHAELIAALAAAHFFAEPDAERVARPAVTELHASAATSVAWEQLPYSTELDLRKHLVAFATFCVVHGRFLGNLLASEGHTGTGWADAIKRGSGRELQGSAVAITCLTEFTRRFVEWIGELQRFSERALFSLDSELLQPEGGEAKSIARLTAGHKEARDTAYDDVLTLVAAQKKISQENATGYYVHALTRATWDYGRSNYVAWWR